MDFVPGDLLVEKYDVAKGYIAFVIAVKDEYEMYNLYCGLTLTIISWSACHSVLKHYRKVG